MTTKIDVCIESGHRRVFASAPEWPGWCRSGRDEQAALDALAAYESRYAPVAKRARISPPGRGTFAVTERLKGTATTDFGAPGVPAKADQRPLSRRELDRQGALLTACWAAFDAAAKAAIGAELRKGPRGGGRELDAIVRHLFEAEVAYLDRLGGKLRGRGADAAEEMAALRRAFLDMLSARSRGETPPAGRRTAPLWLPRFAIRRSAWHALDHAWEIEDRVQSPSTTGDS